jgi:multidrug efflux pump subunit AcrA (membrane-fusion protein)
VTGQVSHYSHENGSRATVKHQKGQVEGTHNVNSYVNETNKGKAKKPTKAELMQQAKAEYAKANRGDGSFAKAAELYEAAGLKEKAEDARALAKRYGHDDKGVAAKRQADTDAAATARAQAKRAASSQARALLLEKAELHEKRAKGNPEDDAISSRLSALNDDLAYVERDDHKGQGDMDKMREAIRKEKPDISIPDLNDEVERRLERIKVLEFRMNHMEEGAPLRDKVKTTEELRRLGWGKQADKK